MIKTQKAQKQKAGKLPNLICCDRKYLRKHSVLLVIEILLV